MNKIRKIAAWLLLAIFVPMVILSSLHVHNNSDVHITNFCKGDKQECYGHLSNHTISIQDCVLCKFLTLTYTATTFFAVVAVCIKINDKNHVYKLNIYQCTHGIPLSRAPPSLL